MITVRHSTMSTADESSEPQWQSQKIGIKAIKAARTAAAYHNQSLQDYLTEVVFEAANWDIEQGHAEYRSRVPAPAEPPRARRGKKPGG